LRHVDCDVSVCRRALDSAEFAHHLPQIPSKDIEKGIKMENNNTINGNSWIAYFDILGFKARISDFERGFGCGHWDLFKQNFYGKLIEELKREEEYQPNRVFITWFSDSFIFFTRDDSQESFAHISVVADRFCQFAVSKSWPLRGAIGFGQLYVDKANNIFLGPGLIDAYEWAERQKWIGLVVTPKANARLCELSVDLKGRNRFKEYEVPIKPNMAGNGTCESVKQTERLFAVKIQELPNVKRWVRSIRDATAKRDPQGYKDRYSVMYENTLQFFES